MSVMPMCQGALVTLWRGSSADDAKVSDVRPGSGLMSRVLVVALALAIGAAAPVAIPQGARAAGLSGQISAARERQKQIEGSLARQKQLLSQLRRDAAATRKALADTDSSLKAITADQRQVRERIAKATAALARVQARHDALVAEMREMDWTLGLLEQELASGQEDLEVRRQALGQRLAEAYRTQNTSLLEQVFTADSFADVVTQTSAYLAYGEHDAQLAEAIAEDQKALDALRLLTSSTRIRTDQLRRAAIDSANDIKARKAELAKAKAALERLEARTRRLQERQQARFQRIAANQRKAQRMVAQQAAAERKLKRRIAGLVREAQRRAARREAARRNAGPSRGGGGGSGVFIWPARGVVTQEYGCTGFSWNGPRGSCAHFHGGIDIAGPSGTPIRAAGNGVVAFVGWNPYGGSNPAFIVVLGHANGLETFYAHMLPRYAVKAGQFVKRGQVIGYMGNTGYSTGTHLHWEVSRNGSDQNPRLFL
jgi:murein DD-endopeptidase MepM/ murein hydrolase activator NlpD